MLLFFTIFMPPFSTITLPAPVCLAHAELCFGARWGVVLLQSGRRLIIIADIEPPSCFFYCAGGRLGIYSRVRWEISTRSNKIQHPCWNDNGQDLQD